MVHSRAQFDLGQLGPSALRDELGILLYGSFGGRDVFFRDSREAAIGLSFRIPGEGTFSSGLVPGVIRLVEAQPIVETAPALLGIGPEHSCKNHEGSRYRHGRNLLFYNPHHTFQYRHIEFATFR